MVVSRLFHEIHWFLRLIEKTRTGGSLILNFKKKTRTRVSLILELFQKMELDVLRFPFFELGLEVLKTIR
jgi:hypothetical protein